MRNMQNCLLRTDNKDKKKRKMGAGGSTIAAYSLFGIDHGAKKKKRHFLRMLGLKGKRAKTFSDVTGFGYSKLNKNVRRKKKMLKKRKLRKIYVI